MSTNTPLAKPQTTRALLLELCQRQRDDTHARDLHSYEHVWDGFFKVIEDMFVHCLIPNKDAFHFHHADLQLRNLLFTIQSSTTVRLTGILDWDSALLAPKFMSTRAPFFLWSEDAADENEEGDALVEPEDADKTELKRIFGTEVGEAFCKESHREEYLIARRMWYFMMNGLRNGGDVFLAEVLEMWGEMYPTR
jgi:thiamine kinase-like enzyme